MNPSATAQRRFFDFLARAHAALPNLQNVLIAGNHDAGARQLAPLKNRLTAAIRDREAAGANAKQALAKREAQRIKRDAAGNEHAALMQKRDALARFASFAPDAAGWLHRLDHAARCRESLEDATTKLRLRMNEEESKTTAADAERTNEAALRKAAADAVAELEKADIAVQPHDGEKIARARNKADSARTGLRELEKHLHKLGSVSRQVSILESEIARLKADNESDGRTLADLKEKRIPGVERTLRSRGGGRGRRRNSNP